MYSNQLSMYSPQASIDRINNQINELEKIRNQIQQPMSQPTNLTQNFQLAPPRDVIRYANSLDEVQRDMVLGDTPYFSKDMSVVWVKNTKGEIRTYELSEIVPKDEKDLQIEMLQAQINELKKEMVNNDTNVTNANATEDSTDSKWDDEESRTTTKEEKSSSVQRIPTSKKR